MSEPSKEAMELADDIHSVFIRARTFEAGQAEITKMIDVHTAKAIKAERERIAGELNARKQTAAITAERARIDERFYANLRHEAQAETYDEAIKIAKGEQP